MNIKKIELPDKWLVHSYYTMCPYAPDGSKRVVVAAADLETKIGKVYILKNNNILNEFGENKVDSNFFHTGFWQTWSPDSKFIYYQGGNLKKPLIVKHEIATGKEETLIGDMEGAPPNGEPIVSCLLGMLYAAGYGIGVYNPEISPAPFEARDKHGLFEHSFENNSLRLALSVNDVLNQHPDKEMLLELDKKLSIEMKTPAGLTLMTYCPRWNPQGTKFLFYFGNHCVRRDEPKIAYVFTCNKDFTDLHLALNLNKGGVHWSWHPDGEHLVGYGRPDDNKEPDKTCMSIVKYDGTGYRQLCSNYGGGHPSICPTDYNLLVTDTYDGYIILWNIKEDKCIFEKHFSNMNEKTFIKGHTLRNETRVCHHPVFTPDGKEIIFNAMEGELSMLYKIKSILE